MRWKQLVLNLILTIFHFFAFAALFYFYYPIANWYLNKIPALGIDLYNSVTYVSFHQKHFSLWVNGFKDIWFGGYPLIGDFPQLHYYLMVPFANFFGTVRGVQYYVMFSLFLLLIFSYLLFYQLSRNIGLAILLSVLVLLSANIYGATTWGGSEPYFSTQFFLPLIIWLLILYFRSGTKRWFWLASLLTGLGFLSHPLPIATFVFPSSAILLMMHPFKNQGWNLLKRLKLIGLFLIGVIFSAFILLYEFLVDNIFGLFHKFGSINFSSQSSASQVALKDTSDIASQVSTFYKNQAALIYSDTNNLLFIMALIGFILFIIHLIISTRKKEQLSTALPFILIVLYISVHILAYLWGYNFLSQGLYRTFWAFPITLAALVALLWGFSLSFLYNLVERIVGKYGKYFIAILISISFLGLTYYTYINNKDKLITQISKRSDTSSAFPEVLSMKLDQKDQEKLKKQLTPIFMDPNDKNKRLYESDAAVNIWWNSLFDLPLARGYTDPPLGTDRRGGIFLLDIAIGNDSLVRDFKFSEEMAKNYAQYLTDWNGLYYFEGGHVSPSSNVPPSSYLLNSDFFSQKEDVTTYGAIHRFATKGGLPKARFDLPQVLKYYKINEVYTSPVLYASNAPAVLVISDDGGYEQIWRILAALNLNSRFIIPAFGGQFIDDLSKTDLEFFDAIILHNYDYRNKDKSFRMIEEYVKNGGKVFIDTGGEIKDSESRELSEIFPIKRTQRKGLKTDWNLKAENDPVTESIDFSKFGPPIFNKSPWKFSFPTEGSGVKPKAKVLLRNYDKPLVAKWSLGSGKVVWSGMNLPYHFVQYTNAEEARFFKNILSELVDLKKYEVILDKAHWQSPENISISSKMARGVIFKEQFYKGWNAKSLSDNKGLKIFPTGPTYPGFMYVPTKNLNDDNLNVQFSYIGDTKYLIYGIINFFAVLLMLELIIFNGRVLGNHIFRHSTKLGRKIFSWWQKEDE